MITLVSSSFFSLPKDDTRYNQDSCLLPMKYFDGYLFAIADGLGGYKGGREASQKVINYLYSKLTFNIENDSYNLFQNLKKEVISLSETNKEFVNAATTLTFCYIKNDILIIGHIGDCRLYAKNNNRLKQVTRDHTQKQQLIDRGVFTKKQLEHAAINNVLTTAISKTLDMKQDISEVPIHNLIDDEGFITLYLMSDGAHSFWEKRPRFSYNTINEPSKFASSLKRRIESGPPIDDYSMISAKFHFGSIS